MSTLLNLELAESCVDGVVAWCAGQGLPLDINTYGYDDLLQDNLFVSDDDLVQLRKLTSVLIEEQLSFERAIAECGYFVEAPLPHGFSMVANKHGNLECRMGTVVGYDEKPILVVKIGFPGVLSIVFGDCEASTADRVRIAAYFVRFFSNLISVGGSVVSDLSQTVRLFRELVRVARLEQRNGSCDSSRDSNDDSNDSDSKFHVPDGSCSCVYGVSTK